MKLFVSALVLTVLFFPFRASADDQNILLLVSHDRPIYHELVDSIDDYLDDLSSSRVRLSTLFLNEVSHVQIKRESPDLLVAIGSSAMEFAVSNFPDTPTLVLFVPKLRYDQLYRGSRSNKDKSVDHGVVVLDQPVLRQVNIAHLLVPDGKIGLVLGPGTMHIKENLKKNHPNLMKHLILSFVDEQSDVMQVTESLLDKVDLLIAIPDALVWNRQNAKYLLYLAWQNRKPVIGYSLSLTRAGAAVSVFSEPEHIGKQGAEKINQWLNGDVKWKQVSAPKYYRYEFNHNMVSYFGLDTERLKTDLEEVP